MTSAGGVGKQREACAWRCVASRAGSDSSAVDVIHAEGDAERIKWTPQFARGGAPCSLPSRDPLKAAGLGSFVNGNEIGRKATVLLLPSSLGAARTTTTYSRGDIRWFWRRRLTPSGRNLIIT
ncbi:hypothetical protein E2C01_004164 [Portunus trituberculatus]|uniref:Uncharacterized protein n=1 Tax=Portunus trituberculatus TaxID=210409 RepID=A0A5B7CP57_PORTR|nr:hypothetical protein [Portunus trituberculatus]